MEFSRDKNLEQLINRMNNGMIKVITGMRRCGKSYLLYNIFRNYLINTGINEDHIICVHLDDYDNAELLDPNRLNAYIKEQILDSENYYILLDEIQLVPDFESLLNGLLYKGNLDVYVTGSNSKFLSSDIITEFRGRGDEVRVRPLTFSEIYSATGGDKRDCLEEYLHFGGMPLCVLARTQEQKQQYLMNLYQTIYLRDLKERHTIDHPEEFGELFEMLASGIGSLTNPKKLSDTFKSVKNSSISPDTVSRYIDYTRDAFIVDKAVRYDIKGKKYISTPSKYYFSDLGIRNAILKYRQYEPNHIMENLIYNELCYRGFEVDVGTVIKNGVNENGNGSKDRLEVDFVANKGYKRFYIQSVYRMDNDEKLAQEQRSLDCIKDSFTKVLIVFDSTMHYQNEKGYLVIGLLDFLMNTDLIN